ncbi:MAG TPA: hypothetical protein PKW79_01615 [Rhabdochlamydiaceae bacterium]|nr:hypothetical protein [Rhabdochlamydiaceae bacterium]
MGEKTEDCFQISSEMDQSGIQDSFCFRALSQAREWAAHLIEGAPMPSSFFYPMGLSDEAIDEQRKIFLDKWTEPEFKKKIKKFSLPLCHRKAEEVIRVTLQLPLNTPLKDTDIQKAVVTACLTPLRQSIGSCFATAPAILTQKNHLDLFVADPYDLLTTGRLKRVVDGNEYTVPLSLSYGVGDVKKQIGFEFRRSPGLRAIFDVDQIVKADPKMTVEELLKVQKRSDAIPFFISITENALLKVWEFTLASFSDIKMEFSKWNLSWSLGLHPHEKGGIGSVLYNFLDQKLQETNQAIENAYREVVTAHEQFKMAEGLLRQASSEAEARRLNAEGQVRLHHLRSCEDLMKDLQSKAKAYADLFPFLIEQYKAKFQEYFQEIYDPEMPEFLTSGPYEDRMAGFRLIYKHGRNDSSLWTRIYNQEQFISVLVEFFTVTEMSIQHLCEVEIETLTTAVIQHVRSDAFIQAALMRAKQSNRLPWSYFSGGTMDQLIPTYFRSRSPLKKETQEIENELDLFVFLIDTLKAVPPASLFLIQSPTHAFSLMPFNEPFHQAWEDRGFTYTWIRDQFLVPGKQFYDEMVISRDEQIELMRRAGLKGDSVASCSVAEFSAQFTSDKLPAFLFNTLPLIPANRCKAILQELVGEVDLQIPAGFLSSREILILAKSIVKNHEQVAKRARELKLVPPVCIFADTNWPSSYFAFVINPCTLVLEVWRTDKTGILGDRLPLVKSWLGKGKDFIWTIYTNKI